MNPDSRSDPRRYNLSKKQLAYLLGEDTGTRQAPNLESDVNEVVQNLDERIQNLVEDLSVLHEKGYLNTETWPKAWDWLAGIHRDDELYDRPVQHAWEMAELRDVKDRYEYIQLAIHLGHVARFLYNDTAPAFDKPLIAMGLLIGLNGGFLKQDADEGISAETFFDALPDEDETFLFFDKPVDDTRETLEDLLKTVDGYLKQVPASDTETGGLRDRLSEADITLTTPLMEEAERHVREREYPPVPSFLDALVEELESDALLQAIEQLADQAQNDMQTLRSTEWRGGRAIEVFYAFYQEGKYTQVGEIVQTVDTDKNQIRKLRNDLLGSESPWSERPLLDEEAEGGYSPTDYGRLLGILLLPDEEDGGEADSYSIPQRKEIMSVCHNYLFENKGEDKREIILGVVGEHFDSIEELQYT